MKTRSFIVLMAIAVAAVGFNAYAFHSGGVAECEGCHSMHEPKSPAFLLVGTDASSACLSCHESPTDTAASSYHISSTPAQITTYGNPIQRTPGGDFGWLRKTFSWGTGDANTEYGYTHGHNILAADQGYTEVQPTSPTHGPNSPGGGFPNSQLGCQSCHDPHGKARRWGSDSAPIYGATGVPIIGSGSYNNSLPPTATLGVGIYRILWGPASPDKPANTNFASYPVAIAPATYNRTEAATQTRVAYGAGAQGNSWGDWCGSCHEDFKGPSKTVHHPADGALGSDIVTKYGTYVSSGIMTGSSGTSYLSLVPFAEATQDFSVLKSHAQINNSFLAGPAALDSVTCLSCHRAHASGFKHALRFYYQWELMTYDSKYPGLDNTSMTSSRKPSQASGRNMADFQAAYYDRAPSFTGPYNRVLCNKCHAQD